VRQHTQEHVHLPLDEVDHLGHVVKVGKDGGAGLDADTGITALALLAFLGAGETHLKGKHRKNVQRGLEYLLAVQKSDGNLAGRARTYAAMYCHGMALLALSEAYALSGDERLLPTLRRAIRYTLAAQHASDGGWRYRAGDTGDMSMFGWHAMGLRSAELAGLKLDPEVKRRMRKFLARVSGGRHGGLASYRPGHRPTVSMTAEALACRLLLDHKPRAAAVAEATNYLLARPPAAGQADYYYWYYASLGLFQLQDERWSKWNEALTSQLLARQRTSGSLAGSFDPDTKWGGYGGRVYSTAMATLCLEVYYRYLPLYGGHSGGD